MLESGDDAFAAAAAATSSVIDPAAVAFSSGGVLAQSFDGTVGANMAPKSVIGLGGNSMAAGPFFDDSPYKFTVLSVPRHDQAMVRARVLVLEALPVYPGARSVEVNTDGIASATIELEGDGALVSGPEGSTVVPDGSGTTASGTGYRAYLVSVPVTHFGDALQVRFQPHNTYALLGTGIAIDSVEISLTTPPADVAESLTVPFIAGSGLGAGLGRLETPGSADQYNFSIDEESGPILLLETRQAPGIRADIWSADTGKLIKPADPTGHKLYRDLPVGDYRLIVTSNGGIVDPYALPVLTPHPQVFDGIAVGAKIENGKIGGVATAGAGNLETTASQDVYTFTLTDPTIVVFDGSGSPLSGSKLIEEATTKNWGEVSSHKEYNLPAGRYRIEVANSSWTGSYTITWFTKPAPQVFDGIAVGAKIENGKIGGVATAGAGNLETTASQDVYTFTLTDPTIVVFDGSGSPLSGSKLIEEATTKNWGEVSSHKEYNLPAGRYRIEVANSSWTGSYTITWFTR